MHRLNIALLLGAFWLTLAVVVAANWFPVKYRKLDNGYHRITLWQRTDITDASDREYVGRVEW